MQKWLNYKKRWLVLAKNLDSFQIIFQDDYLAVVYKPAGLLSVSYPGGHGQTALDMLETAMRKQGTWNNGHHPFAVHRLDRDTSGVLMFALSYPAQQTIMNTWHTMVTERLYRAVGENQKSTKASTLPVSGLIDAPLAQNAYHQSYVPTNIQKEKQQESTQASHFNNAPHTDTHHHKKHRTAPINSKMPSSQTSQLQLIPARTHYKVIEKGSVYTLFELSLDTGKKNQIRAHLAYLGYPLAGDTNYRANTNPFHRLALHARTLDFIHPYTGKKMHFEVPEPANWQQTVIKTH
jgi:23S rRNA pseudouridine1911/1915/1917 synthase